MRRRKKNVYKFAGKKHSKRGKVSLVLAVLSFSACITLVALSVQNQGNASVYIGSAGLFSLILSVASLFIGLSGFGEQYYKLFPVLGSVCSGLILAGWVTLYVVGFYM